MTDPGANQDVLDAEEARCRAIAEGDVDALGALLRDDYTHVTGRASIMNRAQYLEWIGTTPRRHVRHDLEVRRYGDTAVIVGGLTNHLSYDGGDPQVLETMVTQVLVLEDGAWRFAAFHITPERLPG